MKRLNSLLGFLVMTSLLGTASTQQEGLLVRGATYEGIIFTPEMLPHPTANDPRPLVAAVDCDKLHVYWTPSRELIEKVEQAFARKVAEANNKLPPQSSRERGWYTPKHFSRDHQPHLPDDYDSNFLYDCDQFLTPEVRCQYIGVTVSGRRLLVINLAFRDDPKSSEDSMEANIAKHWKSEWMWIDDGGTQIIYDLKTGTFREVET